MLPVRCHAIEQYEDMLDSLDLNSVAKARQIGPCTFPPLQYYCI